VENLAHSASLGAQPQLQPKPLGMIALPMALLRERFGEIGDLDL